MALPSHQQRNAEGAKRRAKPHELRIDPDIRLNRRQHKALPRYKPVYQTVMHHSRPDAPTV